MIKENSLKTWEEKINQFKQSGQNQTVWCKEKGINLRTFNKWYNKFKNQAPANQAAQGVQNWIPLEIVEKTSNLPLNIKVGKVVIEVNEGFNPKLLSDVVKVLGATC